MSLLRKNEKILTLTACNICINSDTKTWNEIIHNCWLVRFERILDLIQGPKFSVQLEVPQQCHAHHGIGISWIRCKSVMMLQLQLITLFSWVCTLGGAKNKPDTIWKYTLFILTSKHCTRRVRMKNSGEPIYYYYQNEMADSSCIMLCTRHSATSHWPNIYKLSQDPVCNS
jgi:hypothetical protein